jgi:8-oxo-dGTP pyrophosphatase MutT (NUDIX family)
MPNTNPWTVLQKNEPFTCPYFTVRRDLVSHAGGAPLAYDSIRMKFQGVCILPIHTDGSTILVGQYRYVLDRYSWELPGGGAFTGASPIDAARTELSEETGLAADYWLQVFDTAVAPGTIDEMTKGFVAWGLREGEAHPEPEEDLAVRRVSFAEAVEMALGGKIGNISSVATLLCVHSRLNRRELPIDLAGLLKI